jgi:hypothetical protein
MSSLFRNTLTRSALCLASYSAIVIVSFLHLLNPTTPCGISLALSFFVPWLHALFVFSTSLQTILPGRHLAQPVLRGMSYRYSYRGVVIGRRKGLKMFYPWHNPQMLLNINNNICEITQLKIPLISAAQYPRTLEWYTSRTCAS